MFTRPQRASSPWTQGNSFIHSVKYLCRNR